MSSPDSGSVRRGAGLAPRRRRARARDAAERERLKAALIKTVGARGFRYTKPPDVAAAAGLPREAFDRHFSDMEDAFLTVWDELAAERAALLEETLRRHAEWRARMRAMAELMFDFLRADPNRARFLMLEPLNAGPQAELRLERMIAAQAAPIDEGRRVAREAGAVSSLHATHVAGAIGEMLSRLLRSGELFTDGQRVMRDLLYMTVRPYLGHEVARQELAAGTAA